MTLPKYDLVDAKDLKFCLLREIRRKTVDEIKANIEEHGFYDARVLTVVDNGNGKEVVDGNHRLQAILELGINPVPCAIYKNTNPYKLAIKGNLAEDTYAPMDLFDWLSIIGKLKDEGLTQNDIGERIGWSESQVKSYSALLTNIVSHVLELTKKHQIGRETKKVSPETFDFTEYWFRTSGLYDLNEKYQQDCLARFIDEKFKWSKQKLQQESAKYKKWQEFIKLAESKLHNEGDLNRIIELIENDSFKTETQLLSKIDDLNKDAKNKLICGDAIQELHKLEDSSIDVVVADPPYGQEYVSWRSSYKDHIGRKGVINDNPEEAFRLLEKACEVLQSKTKPDAHIYVFCSWKTYPEFKAIIERFFEVKNVIVWDKCNHGAGDLEYNWGDRYELIIFATKGKRPLNVRKQNIISISRIAAEKLEHPTQKPVELIKEFLEVSSQPADTICDPFMGTGSTIKACIEHNDLHYIGIELDQEIFEKTKASIMELSN